MVAHLSEFNTSGKKYAKSRLVDFLVRQFLVKVAQMVHIFPEEISQLTGSMRACGSERTVGRGRQIWEDLFRYFILVDQGKFPWLVQRFGLVDSTRRRFFQNLFRGLKVLDGHFDILTVSVVSFVLSTAALFYRSWIEYLWSKDLSFKSDEFDYYDCSRTPQ